jgi:hypothetical protein
MQHFLPIYLPMYGIASLVIAGDAREIPDEEIDGRPAFQGKTRRIGGSSFPGRCPSGRRFRRLLKKVGLATRADFKNRIDFL